VLHVGLGKPYRFLRVIIKANNQGDGALSMGGGVEHVIWNFFASHGRRNVTMKATNSHPCMPQA